MTYTRLTVTLMIAVLALCCIGCPGCSTTPPVVEPAPTATATPTPIPTATPTPTPTREELRAKRIVELEAMYPAKSDAKAPLCDQHAAFESWDGFVTAMMNEADGDLGITLEDLHPVAGAADVAPALTIAGVKADYQAATLNYLRALSATPAMGIPGATRCEYEGNNLDPSQPARIMAEIKSVLERSRISLTVAGTSLDKLRSRAIEVIKDLLAKRRAGVPSSEAAKEQERTVDTSNDYEIQELMNAYLIVRDDVGATVDEDLAIRDANAGP